MKKIIAIVSFMVVTALGCYAQDQTPVTDTRQATQRARIAEGRASGELTRKETARLRGEQRRIRRTERRAKADGTVTPAERTRLQRKQNRANRDIRRQKHDGQTRP